MAISEREIIHAADMEPVEKQTLKRLYREFDDYAGVQNDHDQTENDHIDENDALSYCEEELVIVEQLQTPREQNQQ